ncbi:MarR family winged helix-turn-helix transcriptional regulator [Bradyrhizobium canariense]|uniref:DNA-binding transcriptional regulator, MarR family n=1 Tax=Bradyrhizobium canariense TaxID=255045 RepID=A0A1H2B5Q2_9BRAD|nr:MarR family transcriptional regulator [Bradyrhizobium canariense]SDT53605.1 DNA-binding transcriptional regulator, MarR family [Bradyrhizobium canariense]
MPATKTLATNEAQPRESHIGGILGEEHIAVLLSSVGTRLNRGATAYYRTAWNLSMVEWRLLIVLKDTEFLNVGELSEAADLDKAAVSRSLALLEERKFVSVEQTRTRGRAAIAKLTVEGRELSEKLLRVSLEREALLFKYFTPADKEHLNVLLRQLTRALAGPDWDY